MHYCGDDCALSFVKGAVWSIIWPYIGSFFSGVSDVPGQRRFERFEQVHHITHFPKASPQPRAAN
jgi:hypothetical protein